MERRPILCKDNFRFSARVAVLRRDDDVDVAGKLVAYCRREGVFDALREVGEHAAEGECERRRGVIDDYNTPQKLAIEIR